jgi:hypothetical protein
MAIPASGYDSATITNPGSALTDFTLIIDLSRMSSSWWADVNTSDGTRGRAFKNDGSTELACDWIDFDNTGETGFLRVKWTGTLAASGTQIIRIYAPNTRNVAVGASDTYGSDNAYDTYWEAYWPYDTDFNDRTVNSVDGSIGAGTPAIGTGGKIGNELVCENGEWLEATMGTLSDSQITIMGWGYPSASSVCMIGSQNDFEMLLRIDGGNLEFILNSFSSNDRVSGSTSINTTGVWQHLGGRFDESTLEVFYNGSSDGSVVPVGSWGDLDDLNIGTSDDGPTRDWVGSIDDLQIHSIGRNDDWIAQEYAQTNDNATFWGTWSWNAAPSGGNPWYYYAQQAV